jgi:hypothetical protein
MDGDGKRWKVSQQFWRNVVEDQQRGKVSVLRLVEKRKQRLLKVTFHFPYLF